MSRSRDKKGKLLTSGEVGELCGGFREMTVIRWSKKGYLKAFFTPGGHRRYSPADVIRFLEEKGMFVSQELKELAGEMAESPQGFPRKRS